MNELHLFAGAGGGILGGTLLGHTCVCAVEIEPYCRKVLLQRQRDDILSRFPIWDDVTTFDGKPWRGKVDVVCGGFPCQDISCSGNGAGITGERSGLWSEMARIIGEVRPRFVFIENSPMLRTRGLTTVLKDLAEMGYDARWGVYSAGDVGARHKRERLWIVADSERDGLEGWNNSQKERQRKIQDRPIQTLVQSATWADVSNPRTFGGCDVVASRVDRLKAIGNGQVPAVAKLAWTTLRRSISNAQ